MKVPKVNIDPEKAYHIGWKGVFQFLFGKAMPALYTQFVVWWSLPFFLYFFAGSGLNLLALRMIDNLPEQKTEQLKAVFLTIGTNYGVVDIFTTFLVYTLVVLACSLLFFVSLLFIWRQREWAMYLAMAAVAVLLSSPIVLLGWEYFKMEVPIWENVWKGITLVLLIVEWRLFLNRFTSA